MRSRFVALCGFIVLLSLNSAVQAQGVILQGAGPVSRSMGGASTAAPVDALGALYWNPASISGMSKSETSVALDLLFVNHSIASTIGGASGTTDADAGVFPIPNVGIVHKLAHEAYTLGMSVQTLAGFGTNIPADPSNPILNPPPTGLGQISSSALFLQIAPVLSVAVTDNLSFAAGPTMTTGRVNLEPFVLDSANANGTYSTGNATRYHWGGGFQLGTYYILDEQWRFGASFKSPVWMEKFEYNSLDENGLPRKLFADFDLPMILSLGTSCQVDDATLLALDVRYLDYANTDGLGDAPEFDATGALGGLGYSSIVAVGLGAQRQVSDMLTIRAGYTYNQNPISDSEAFFNIASPVIYQHMLSTGASVNLSENFSMNLAYSIYLENDRSGPVVLPGIGPVPGSNLTNTVDAHALAFGFTMRN